MDANVRQQHTPLGIVMTNLWCIFWLDEGLKSLVLSPPSNNKFLPVDGLYEISNLKGPKSLWILQLLSAKSMFYDILGSLDSVLWHFSLSSTQLLGLSHCHLVLFQCAHYQELKGLTMVDWSWRSLISMLSLINIVSFYDWMSEFLEKSIFLDFFFPVRCLFFIFLKGCLYLFIIIELPLTWPNIVFLNQSIGWTDSNPPYIRL